MKQQSNLVSNTIIDFVDVPETRKYMKKWGEENEVKEISKEIYGVGAEVQNLIEKAKIIKQQQTEYQ